MEQKKTSIKSLQNIQLQVCSHFGRHEKSTDGSKVTTCDWRTLARLLSSLYSKVYVSDVQALVQRSDDSCKRALGKWYSTCKTMRASVILQSRTPTCWWGKPIACTTRDWFFTVTAYVAVILPTRSFDNDLLGVLEAGTTNPREHLYYSAQTRSSRSLILCMMSTTHQCPLYWSTSVSLALQTSLSSRISLFPSSLLKSLEHLRYA